MNLSLLNSNLSYFNQQTELHSKTSISNFQPHSFLNPSNIPSFKFDESRYSKEDKRMSMPSQMLFLRKPAKVMSSELPKLPVLTFSKPNVHSYESVQSSLPKNNLDSDFIEKNKYFGVGLKNLSKIRTDLSTQSSIEDLQDNSNFYQNLLKNDHSAHENNPFGDCKSMVSNHTNGHVGADNNALFRSSMFETAPKSYDFGVIPTMNLNTYSNIQSGTQNEFNLFNLVDSNDKCSSQVVSISNPNSESSKLPSNSASKLSFKVPNTVNLNVKSSVKNKKNTPKNKLLPQEKSIKKLVCRGGF